MDHKGPRAGYIIGLSIYVIGMFLVNLINTSFSLALVGYIIFSFGQPFIVNAPAKIATVWFLPENVIIILISDRWQFQFWWEQALLVQEWGLPSLLCS